LRSVEPRAFWFVVIGVAPNLASRLLQFSTGEQLGDEPANQRHARLSSDEDDLVEVFRLQLRVSQRAQAMDARSRDDVARQVFEFLAREPVSETERGRQKRQRDFHCRFRGQLDFGLLGGFANAREHRKHFGFRISDFGVRSGPPAALIFSTRKSTMRLSKSSPPRRVLPFVESTWNTPSFSSRIERSNVPPPKS